MGHRQPGVERGLRDWDLGLVGVSGGPSCSKGRDSKRLSLLARETLDGGRLKMFCVRARQVSRVGFGVGRSASGGFLLLAG